MKPQATTADPAPALGRGLKLLELLHRQGARSLEQLAADSGWPKSSVLRLLQSLIAAGAAARDPQTLAYRAMLRLVPVDSTDRRLKQHCAASMAVIGDQCGHTVELHRYDASGLEMIDRYEPPPPEVSQAVVRAVARVGWRRDIQEMDALTQIVCAFAKPAVKAGPQWHWRNGRKKKLTVEAVRRLLSQVRKQGVAVDLGINEHGVRRYAAPIFDAQRKLIAVLALAQACSPLAVHPDAGYAQAVRRAAIQISSTQI